MMATIEKLIEERRERGGRDFTQPENDEFMNTRQITCLDLVEMFGRDYVKKLTSFEEEEVNEILLVCEETLKPTGPGRAYKDMKCRVVIYLTWLVSGWTIRGLANLFHMTPPSIQRTINYVMSGLTHSLKRAYLPQKREDIHISSKFKHFPQAIGAVDGTLIRVQKPKSPELDHDYYSGKHGTHGAKIQVTVSADGQAIHVSPLIPGRRHDAYLFRNSGLAEFMQKKRRVSGRMEIAHPALLADSGYTGLDEVYYELITCKKKPPMGELSQKDADSNSKLHSDRVLVENFFGCLKVTFGILATPYRCALNSLEDVVVTCICLLNLKLRLHPLRALGPTTSNNRNGDDCNSESSSVRGEGEDT